MAIEFDTYENYSAHEDPNGNHVSVHARPGGANSAHHRFSLACSSDLPVTLHDGKPHEVIIAYDMSESTLWVVLEGVVILCSPIELVRLLGDTSAFLGFTAGTGGLTQEHRILDWSVARPRTSE